jgi:SNARE protein 1
MAMQLKRNALHFSDSLAKDQAVVSEAEQKLEGNYSVIERERIRLRDHTGKSRGTTCLVVMIVLAVVLLFAMMVMLIRISRK